MELRPMSESKANFSNMFSTVIGPSLSEYRGQYETVESTYIETSIPLDCRIELEEDIRIVVRPTKTRLVVK